MTHRIALGLGIIPIALFFAFIITYGTSEFPYGDANVASADIAIKAHDQTLTVNDIVASHNGHRIIFTRAITTLLTLTTRWDNTYEIAVNVLLGLINTALVIGLLRPILPRHWGYMILPTALFVLSVDQALNWFGGLQSTWHFALLFALLALLTLSRLHHKPTFAVFIAIFCAYCASFSSANGLATWGIVFITMLWMGYSGLWRYGLVIIAGILCGILFLSGSSTNGGAMTQISIPPPLELTRYILTMLGRPLANDLILAPIIGFIGLALFIILCACLWRDGQRKTATISIGLGIFAWGSAGMVAITRYHFFGMNSALLEHYQQAIIPFWIGIFILLILIKKRVAWVLMVMLVGLHSLMLINNWSVLEWQVYGKNGAVIPTRLAQISEQGDCLKKFPFKPDFNCFGAYPPYDYADNMAQIAQRGLSGYADIPITNRLTDWSGEPILFVGDSAWETVTKAHFWLNGIDNRDILYILPQAETRVVDSQYPRLPNPPHFVAYGEGDTTAQTVRDFVQSAENVWYITTPIPYVGEVFVGYRGVLGESFDFVYTLELGDGMIASLYQRRGE